MVSIHVTGVGMPDTIYNLTKLLTTKKYDFVIQAGIAGSFNKSIAIGEVVMVHSEAFADMGAEDHENFINVFDLGLVQADEHPYTCGRLLAPSLPLAVDLKKVSGITLNTTSGNQQTIDKLAARFAADVESMEGASFFYTCLKEGVAFMQVRAISNYVEPRDKSKWNIGLAVHNLNGWLTLWLDLNS
jgi:futalosine hydrolase